jgi:hypothetical protein
MEVFENPRIKSKYFQSKNFKGLFIAKIFAYYRFLPKKIILGAPKN